MAPDWAVWAGQRLLADILWPKIRIGYVLKSADVRTQVSSWFSEKRTF